MPRLKFLQETLLIGSPRYFLKKDGVELQQMQSEGSQSVRVQLTMNIHQCRLG
jgi:hypothetical protein